MITETAFEQTWTLQGRLSGQWAADLIQMWQESRGTRVGRRCVVNLEDVISVDRQGEGALLAMATEGAAMIASRAYMKYILEGLHVKGE